MSSPTHNSGEIVSRVTIRNYLTWELQNHPPLPLTYAHLCNGPMAAMMFVDKHKTVGPACLCK